MTDTQAPGFRHPEQHLARRVEKRTPTEMMNLLTFDALIATYGMDAAELHAQREAVPDRATSRLAGYRARPAERWRSDVIGRQWIGARTRSTAQDTLSHPRG